jgi:hypothetical protein
MDLNGWSDGGLRKAGIGGKVLPFAPKKSKKAKSAAAYVKN